MMKNNYLARLLSYAKIIFFALLTVICLSDNLHAQTQLIPAGDGGFENATSTFAANNWIPVLPGAARQWQVGIAAGSVAGGTKAAYVGAAANYNGANTAQVGHFYRDLTIPAGATSVTLTFQHRLPNPDPTFDYLRVFTTTTANTPVSGTNPGAGYTMIFENTSTTYAAFTAMTPIDLTPLAGTTVRLVFTNVADGIAPASGIAVDNISLTYIAAAPCSGVPTGGTTQSTANPVCSGVNFTLSLSGASSGTGLTYQWQSSPDNITFANIAGATSVNLTTSLTASTYYRCQLTCPSFGPGLSSSLLVSKAALAVCYCIPTHTCTNDRITNFLLNTLSNASGATCNTVPAGYSLYGTSPANLTTTLDQGGSYTATISCIAGNANGTGVAIWIDYNDNGTFDASERNDNGATKFISNTTGTLTVNVPVSAPVGNHSMRVMAERNVLSNAIIACTASNAAGEIEDYTVTIAVATACSGNPNGGTTQSSANPACSGASFTLSLNGATSLAGLTYQWQSSPDNITYTNIGGATAAAYIATQAAATYYRNEVTCTNGGSSALSVPLQVNVTPLENCYCIGQYDNGCGIDYISNVTFGTINNTTTCTGSLPTNRTAYTTPNPTFYRGFSYPISVTTDGDLEAMRAWIDYDHSFTFIAGESVLFAAAGGPPQTTTGTVLIPLTANLGQTLIRVRCRYSANVGTGAACTNFVAGDYGETEDYIITIADAPSCSGTPNAGATAASVNPVCSGTTVTFSLSGATVEAGLTYQWQASSDNITYTNVSGATSSTYAAPVSTDGYGRCRVTCTNSGLSSNSTPVHMTLSPFYNCYCAPSYGFDCGIDYISNVTFNGINNTTTCSGTTPSNLTTYNTPNPTFSQGFTYPISVTTDGDVEGLGVWIDYSQNGVFDANATEYILSAAAGGPPQTTTANITIPTGVPSGVTKMRVRCRYSGAVANTAACTGFGSGYGETEDYLITIGPQICIANPTSPANGASMCPSGFTNLSWPSLSGATGYNVYLSTVNPPTTLVSANQPGNTYTPPSGLSPGNIYYWSIVPVGPGATSCSSWSFTIKAIPNPSPGSNSPVCEGFSLSLFGNNLASGQINTNWSWSGPSFTSSLQNPILSNATAAMNGTYTLTITNNLGCTASSSTSVIVNPNPVITIGSQTNVSCNGQLDGEVDLDATTGTPSYIYTLEGSPTLDGIYSGLGAGTYLAEVIDDNGCEATDINVTITEPPVLTAAAGSNTPVCTGTPINFSGTPTGGTSGYSYVWTGPNSFTSTSATPVIASATAADAGQYDLTITDAHECTASNSHTVAIIAAPTAAASLTSTPNVCTTGSGFPLQVSLAFTGTGPWNYTVSDGTQSVSGSTSSNPASVSIPLAGQSIGAHTYTVTSITDANCPAGGTSSGSATVYVSSGPPTNTVGTPVSQFNYACSGDVQLITVNAVGGQNIRFSWNLCSSSSVVLFSNNIGGPWSPGPFQTTLNQVYAQFGAVTPNQSGYSISVQGVNGCGSTNNKCLFIRGVVSVPGTITPANNVVACPNDVKSYSCGSSGGATQYNWTLGGSPAAITTGQGTTNVQVTFPAGFTSGQLCVTGQLPCGGSSVSAPRCMTISNAPAVPGTFTAGPSSVCPGSTGVTFTIPAVTGATGYNWTTPAGTTITSGQNTPSIQVSFPNPYTGAPPVCVTATSACGSSVARCKTVGSSIPIQPGAMSGPTTNICNSTAQYSVANVAGASSYVWTNPAGTTIASGQGSNTILLNVSSTFTSGFLSVTANTALCTPGSSPARTITIYGKPNQASVITANPPSFCNGGFPNFSVTPAVPQPYNNWSVTNGTITAGQGTTNIDVTWGTGTGTVNVTASNTCGAANVRTQSFTGMVCREEAELNVQSSTFNVYPNPAHDKVTVSIDVEEQTQFNVKLRDISGRVILSEDHKGAEGLNAYEMDLRGFAKGIYMIEVQSGSDSWKTKVVIE